MKPRKVKPKDPYAPEIFETFRRPGHWEINPLMVPSCFNGYVNVEKHRVTVEKIKEPIGVVAARLQDLWDRCDNHHNWLPLKKAAEDLGVTLQGRSGAKREGGE